MTSSSVAFFCVLVISELALAQTPATCTTREIQMKAEPMCEVSMEMIVDFDVKTITPFDTCDETKTVCLEVPTSVTFSGTFVDGTILTIYGVNKTAQVPVVLPFTRMFATPSVGRFPTAGALSLASALEFKLPFPVAADAKYTGCSKATAGSEAACDTTALCCLITDSELKLWGTIGSEIFVSFTKAYSNPVYIPLIVLAANDMTPPSLMLEPRPNGLVFSTVVTIPFIAEEVKQGTEALTPAGSGACTGKCYSIRKSILIAFFSGKVPTEPVSYIFSNDQKKIIYTFGNAGAVMKSGLVTVVMVPVVFIMSRI